MKTAIILMGVALLATGAIHAQNSVGLAVKSSGTAFTELIAGSHWAWYEGTFDRYSKGKMKYWVEFYKDGTARVPWRDHPQLWTFAEPNVLTLTDSGLNPDKHIFFLNLENKSGSAQNQNLHIRYEKKATKPSRFK